jgi:hypothetical protein
LQVIVAAHSLASFAFLLSDEPLYIKVAVRRGFFNKLLSRRRKRTVLEKRKRILLVRYRENPVDVRLALETTSLNGELAKIAAAPPK